MEIGISSTGSVTDDRVSAEFDRVDFGDQRLSKRFRSLIIDLLGHCGNTLASSFGSWSKIKASYRFFANPRVTFHSMLEPHIAASLSRLSNCSTALILQDTTYFDFSARKKAKNLDLVHRGSHGGISEGLILHNKLAVTTDGVPLGILDQRFIDRQQDRKPYSIVISVSKRAARYEAGNDPMWFGLNCHQNSGGKPYCHP